MASAPAAPAAGPPATAPAASNLSATSLYCGDLEPSCTEAQLYELFSTIGPVVSIRVCRDLITRRSLGYAYVNFQQGPDAARAIDVLNFQVVNGKPIRIMYSQRDPALRKSGVGNIFIKNLDKDIDNKALYDTFAQFGNIVSAKVATDSQSQSKGYGFVQFDTAEAADGAISKVNGMLMNDKQVYVGPFQRRGERGGGPTMFNNVYVKNLHENVTEDQLREVFERRERMEKMAGANLYIKNLEDTVDDAKLRELFAEFGTITSCRVMRDTAGASRGSAFVAFSSADEATRAVTEMNGKMAGNKPLYVALAQRKEDRRMRLQAQFAQRAVAAGGMPNMGPYSMPPPGAPMYYGQPPPGVMGPPQPQPGFGMPMMPPGGPGRGPMGPGGPGMQYVMPMPQRQGAPGQRGRGGRGRGGW